MAVDASIPVGSGPVAGAIRKAARATGTSFDYLLATAKVESDLDPNLTMRTSTATGLFQFIEQTWLATLKQAGPAFGYGHYADAISRTPSGRYVVEDGALRNEIMQLRKDPNANAIMGGVFTQQNTAVLAERLGRRPTESELYVGHFFGPHTGAKALALAQSNPALNAAELYPAAARANRSIFYDKQGNARSIAGVCAELMRRYQVARAESRPSTIAAANTTQPPPRAAAPTPSPAGAAAAVTALTFAPASAPTPTPGATAFAADPPATTAAARADPALFHSLFQTGERREAIAPAISELWGQPRTALSAPADAPADKGAGSGALNLFRDPAN
jgi:hypothetical protein